MSLSTKTFETWLFLDIQIAYVCFKTADAGSIATLLPGHCAGIFLNGMYAGRLTQEFSEERGNFINFLDDASLIAKVDQPLS